MTKSKSSLWLVLAYLVLAVVALLLAPWWGLAVVSLLYGLAWRTTSPGLAFWPGLSVGAVAFLLGAVLFGGTGDLPDMLAELFGLGGRWSLFLVMALVGGLLAGVCAMTAAYASAVARPRRVTVAASK